jgi:hypothetical protein
MNININKLEITETFNMYDGLETLALVKHDERQFIRYWIAENDNEIGFLLSEIDDETLKLFRDNELSLQKSMLQMGNNYKITYPIQQKTGYKEVKNLDGKVEVLIDYKGEHFPEQVFLLKDFYSFE